MKILKEVTETGIINHRDAFFKAALCIEDRQTSLIFAVVIRNPEDKISNLDRVNGILDGRIQKRFIKGLYNSRIEKFTSCIMLNMKLRFLFSKEAMSAMLTQFKRIKERNLADELGLKWNLQEEDLVRELSVENNYETTTNSYTLDKLNTIADIPKTNG